MASSSQAVTLQELGTHLLNEVIRADAQMQLNQRQTWRELIDMNTQLVDSLGMGPASFLGVDEMRFDLALSPAKPSWWKRFGFRVGLVRDPYKVFKNYYQIHRKKDAQQPIVLSVVVSRNNKGKWDAEYKSDQIPELNPKDTHVAGVTG